MGLMDYAEDLYNAGAEQVNGLAEQASDLYQGAQVSAGEMVDNISEKATDIAGGAYDTACGYYDQAKEVIEQHPELIGGPVGDAPVVREYLGDAIDAVGSTIGGIVDSVVEKIDEMTSKSGMGSEVDALMEKSPTLTKNIEALNEQGWTTVYGDEGTVCDKENKRIIINPSEKGDTVGLVQSLSHETGHALYTVDAAVPMDGLTREEFVKKNMMRDLKDEGEATIMNMEVRNEIMKNTQNPDGSGGTDIKIAGVGGAKYEELAKKYPDPKDRDKLREEIGKAYAQGEHTGNTGETYEDYYKKQYEKEWDKSHGGAP